MATRFPDELYVEVASHATASTQAAMALTARRLPDIVAPFLYSHVVLAFSAAPLFFRTLRLRPELRRLVIFLHFLATTSHGRHEGDDFEAAIASLIEVQTLHIMCLIDVDTLLTKFASLLKAFTCGIPVCDSMYHFLVQQPHITTLSIHHTIVHPRFEHPGRPAWFLGNLNQVDAPIDNICDLIVGTAVRRLRIRYTEFDLLHRAYLPLIFIGLSSARFTHLDVSVTQILQAYGDDLCVHLPALRLLIVRGDSSWGSSGVASHSWRWGLAVKKPNNNLPVGHTKGVHRHWLVNGVSAFDGRMGFVFLFISRARSKIK
ncbi:hypothetical protein C8F04DRAFT_1196948 [Mycena alexandri]|uniref:Uncharacterized protein n=1 Tax=Mycena alexandri TaxID=1745969 RepID=A0AAD6WQR1_9AGAR|nr:hypothetical protein C8F04DRAFT_1196948 [Mycena alexandri]